MIHTGDTREQEAAERNFRPPQSAEQRAAEAKVNAELARPYLYSEASREHYLACARGAMRAAAEVRDTILALRSHGPDASGRIDRLTEQADGLERQAERDVRRANLRIGEPLPDSFRAEVW